MEVILRSLLLLFVGILSINGLETVQMEDTYFTGGRFMVKGISAEYCVRYCRKLGNCWGADYFRYGGHCSVHMDDSICDPDRRRFFEGADHFRIKECVGEDPGVFELPVDDRGFPRTPDRLDNPDRRHGERPSVRHRLQMEQLHHERSSEGPADNKQQDPPLQERHQQRPQVPDRKDNSGKEGVRPTRPSTVFMEELDRDDFLEEVDGKHLPENKEPTKPNQEKHHGENLHQGHDDHLDDFRPTRYRYEDKQLAELKAHMDAKAYTHDCFLHIYESSYAYGGFITYKNISLSKCADECTRHPYCNSLNFKKEGGLCAFLSTTQNVDKLVSSYCCHHVSVSCHKDNNDITTTTGPFSSTAIPDGSSTPVADVPNTTPLPSQDTYPDYPFSLHPATPYPTRPPHGSYPDPTKLPHRPRPDPDKPFIDGVCPFLVQRGTSRVGGIIQEDMADITTYEGCVNYCYSQNGLCYGVDWNTETKHCFRFDTPDDISMMNFTDKYIIHAKYNPCESIPEQQCIVHGPVSYSQNTVVSGTLGANIAHTVESCDTYCFFKYSFSATSDPNGGVDNLEETLERGCGDNAYDYMRWRRCVSPPRTPTSISTMCHCRGDACNAVGYAGLYQLYAYYPFDYDTQDLSGYNRHGKVEGTLKYTTLERRSLRTAAVFDGRTAVIVKAMKLIHFSDVQPGGDLKAASALSLWMYRMDGEEDSMTILSNAEDRHGSSIEVYSDSDPNDDTQHTITVSILLGNQSYTTTSKPYPTNAWQFVCMNIDNGGASAPSMNLYVGEDAAGPMLEAQTTLPTVSKNLDVTDKHLTIGKQSGKGLVFPFTGFLDEVRLFQGELTYDDITATMLQYNYYPQPLP